MFVLKTKTKCQEAENSRISGDPWEEARKRGKICTEKIFFVLQIYAILFNTVNTRLALWPLLYSTVNWILLPLGKITTWLIKPCLIFAKHPMEFVLGLLRLKPADLDIEPFFRKKMFEEHKTHVENIKMKTFGLS